MLPGKPCCAICSREITNVEARLYGTCDHWKCRQQHRVAWRAQRQQRLERERRQREEVKKRARKFRDQVAGSLGIDQPKSFAAVPVPANQSPIASLPAKRRDEFRENLVQLIREASEQTPASEGSPQDSQVSVGDADDEWHVSAVLQSACATCEGYCCTQGGTHAYLSADAIRRYMDQHPAEQAEEVLAAFLSRIGNRTYQDSCVYHGRHGCTLPRSMRASACNAFECIDLKDAQAEFSGRGPHRAFLAALDGDQLVRFAFVDEDHRVKKASRKDGGIGDE